MANIRRSETLQCTVRNARGVYDLSVGGLIFVKVGRFYLLKYFGGRLSITGNFLNRKKSDLPNECYRGVCLIYWFCVMVYSFVSLN